jgi:hypothetical protein
MAYSDDVEVVRSVVVPSAAREIPAISIVGYEQDWSRSLKNVAADNDTQIGWRELHEA